MRLVDVNVLVYAHRLDAARHQDYADWLRGLLAGQEPYGVSDLVLSGFLRIVTNPKVFKQPTPMDTGLAFTQLLRTQPNCVPVEPGPRHWDILTRLCQDDFLSYNDPEWEGLLKHGSYHESKGLGVDESVMWGDYWFLDALDEVDRWIAGSAPGTPRRTIP